MTTNVLELATTLKCLGAKWLPEKKKFYALYGVNLSLYVYRAK